MELIYHCTMGSFWVVGPQRGTRLLAALLSPSVPPRLREDGRAHFRISTLSPLPASAPFPPRPPQAAGSLAMEGGGGEPAGGGLRGWRVRATCGAGGLRGLPSSRSGRAGVGAPGARGAGARWYRHLAAGGGSERFGASNSRSLPGGVRSCELEAHWVGVL